MDNLNQAGNINLYCGIEINNLHFIGQGCQGKVYLLPDGKVIKIFIDKSSCEDQLYILQRAYNSRFFPKVYKYDDYSIIMDFISGVPIKKYFVHTKISEKLSFELVELIKEFEKLEFTRLDIRLSHIFVQTDESIKIIDPRKSFEKIQPYPLLMLNGLKKIGVLEKFFDIIKCEYKEIYIKWKKLWISSKM